jgi:uncharacterized SAM-binding protein YcdF (DUF218 family)
MRRGLAWSLLVLAGVAALLWLGAFLRFVGELPRAVADPDRRTDAIVVLTGGAARLDVGLELLQQGKADRMFVSGVNPGTTRNQVQELFGRPELFECCVELGFAAADTVGNALETAAWVEAGGYRSLRVVTAAYHMPRSMVELSLRMPEVELVPHPVFPDRFRLDRWWTAPGTAQLLATEFNKHLLALVRARLQGVLGLPV